MAKKALLTIDGVHKKVKKGLLTIDGTHKKVKKAFMTIGGVARPCWSGGELAYYGTVTPLSAVRADLAATSVGEYALFGGGFNGSSYLGTMDAYDKSLTRTSPTAWSRKRSNLGAATIGDYALFGGGKDDGTIDAAGYDSCSEVDAYDKSLTRTVATSLTQRVKQLAATTVSDYALFGGGLIGENAYGAMNAYDKSLTKTQPTALFTARYDLAATSVGEYALFHSGRSSGYTRNFDYYNKSLTRSNLTLTSGSARSEHAATTVGDYALFAGGMGSTDGRTDAFDTSVTMSNPTALSHRKRKLTAITIGDYALFVGGFYSEYINGATTDVYYKTVDVYDKSLTRTTFVELSQERGNLAAATVGDYALIAGGYNGSNYLSAVDAYMV